MISTEKPTDQELMALANLKDNQHFAHFMGWIERWAQKEVEECVTAENARLNQGRAQVLLAIGDVFEKATEHYRGRVARKAIQSSKSSNAF